MSNVDIDLIYGQDAIKQVELMTAKLAENVAQVDKITTAASAMNKAMGSNTSGGLKEQIKDVDLLARANKQLELANSNLGKEIAQVREATRQLNTENRLSAKENLAVESSYDKLNAQVEKMKLAYKKMAEEQRESTSEGKKLAAQIDIQTNKLKALDATMGVHNRHVGDYKNQLKDLGAQIQKNVLEYNALSAAQKKSDVGTAMKSNIMNLGDTYRNLATGTSTASSNMLTFEKVIEKAPSKLDKVVKGVGGFYGVLKEVANILPGLGIAGLFGAIGSGIVMLIPEIGKFFDKLINGSKEAREKVKALSEDIGKQTGQFETLTRQLADHNLNKDQHVKIAEKLQKLYPTALKNYSAEEIAAGKAAGAIMLIKDALIAVAMARAAQADIDKQAGEKYANEKSIDDLKAKLELEKENQKVFLAQTKTINRNDNYYNLLVERANRSTSAISSMSSEIESLTKKNAKLDESMNKAANSINNFNSKANQGGLNSDGSDLSKGGGKSNKATKTKEEDIIKPWITSYKMLRINFEQFRGELTDETRKAVEKNLDDLIKVAKDKMAGNPISFTWTWADSLEAFAEQATIFLTKTQEIVSEAGEAINTISQVSTDKELVRLDQKEKALKNYYDNELRFIEESGMSSDRKEREKRKLEAETEAKRKQIDRDRITALRKQASIEKATAIANIIVTNALAIAKQLVATPLPAGAVFVASQVALGAAQLYAAINAPLPQYAKGRKGGKAEFAETNEQGAELHITKDGKAYIPNEGERGVTFLDEGTSVLPADITKQIMSASYITLAQATQGKTEALQLALLEKTDKEIIELIGLRKDLRAKEMSTTFNNNTSFEAWKNMWKK